MEFFVEEGFALPKLKNFEICTIEIDSKVLKGNKLKDSTKRYNPILIPKKKPKGTNGFPVVLVLAGFTGNGTNYFGIRSFEDNFPQTIDRCYTNQAAPHAVYVFVDAMTSLGGSQFLNSSAVGNYEDYIVKELVEVLQTDEDISKRAQDWCVMGGSSGGYGALHLSSKYPGKFGYCGAIAPDSFFESVYLNDLYRASGQILEIGGYNKIRQKLKDGELTKMGGWHEVLNAVAMTACYSPKKSGGIQFPIDLTTGKLDQTIWRQWKENDPVEFLPRRKPKLKGAFLEVGIGDEHNLQLGARQVRDCLKKLRIPTHFFEFPGGHRDLSSRRPAFLKWLRGKWNQ